MGRQGEFVALFHPQATPEAMAEAIRRAIAASPRPLHLTTTGERA
jgi:hypothetical protein